MITRIELSSYKGFDNLDLDLGQYPVIVGPNGADKTTGTPTQANCMIAASVNLRHYEDSSLQRFRDQLRGWFPQGENHAA